MMNTIIDFAKLSLYVYHDPKDGGVLYGAVKTPKAIPKENFKPRIYEQNGFYEVLIDKNVQNNLGDDFYASFFVQVENRKAAAGVLAIRGTDNFNNADQDFKSWWENFFDNNAKPVKPEYYTSRAFSFYNKVRQYTRDSLNIPPNKMFITGHSLGGAIAAILPTDYGVLARAVTFNAPGISGMQGVRDLSDAVINFRAEHDFVSAIDKPIGSHWFCKVPQGDKEATEVFNRERKNQKNGFDRLNIINDMFELTEFFDSVKDQHSMDNLLQAMQNAHDPSVDFYDPVEIFFAMPPMQLPLPFEYLGG